MVRWLYFAPYCKVIQLLLDLTREFLLFSCVCCKPRSQSSPKDWTKICLELCVTLPAVRYHIVEAENSHVPIQLKVAIRVEWGSELYGSGLHCTICGTPCGKRTCVRWKKVHDFGKSSTINKIYKLEIDTTTNSAIMWNNKKFRELYCSI